MIVPVVYSLVVQLSSGSKEVAGRGVKGNLGDRVKGA
jgi:hypothetical protein